MNELEERGGTLWWGDIAFVPSIHGRVAFAREARRIFLSNRFPTVAVELPESLAERITEGIRLLPRVAVVSYEETSGQRCYVPLDPCDSIVEGLRLGLAENCRIEWIDRDVEEFERMDVALPDPYAMTRIGLPSFFQAVRPALPVPAPESQDGQRELHMARRLHALHASPARKGPILCVLGIAHLAGVSRLLGELEAGTRAPALEPPVAPPFDVSLHLIGEDSLYHVLGELPFTSSLYERFRGSITLEEFEAVHALKALLLEAREAYQLTRREEHERIALSSLQGLLRFLRNLCLLGKRLTPTLFELAVAARGLCGGEFALQVIETARSYRPAPRQEAAGLEMESAEEGGATELEDELEADERLSNEPEDGEAREIRMSEDAMDLGDGGVPAKKRYLDTAKEWKTLRLRPPPPRDSVQSWKTAWNPCEHCSWTPEDVLVESFAGHVRARALLEAGLAQERLEEFVTSFKDGIHLRETLRNLHLGKIIVKETPQVRGSVGAVVIIYERPDRQRFPWRVTWHPEFEWESLLVFYATDYHQHLIGPGIARARYGGQLFLKPGWGFGDIWRDPTLAEARDDAERLVFAAAAYSQDRFIAYVGPGAPSARMKAYAARYGKRLIYLPLSGFSRRTIGRLRNFHVLNGKAVRGYASQYIR